MRAIIALFALGVWLLQREAELPDMRYAWLVALGGPCFVLRKLPSRSVRAAASALIALSALAAGFFWAAGFAHLRMADALPFEWEGRNVELVGVIATLPQPYERSVRFDLNVEEVLTPDAEVPRRVALAWWGRAGELPDVHAGERWRLTVRMKRPHGTSNPHGFDYEAWLIERGVRANGYVRPRTVRSASTRW